MVRFWGLDVAKCYMTLGDLSMMPGTGRLVLGPRGASSRCRGRPAGLAEAI